MSVSCVFQHFTSSYNRVALCHLKHLRSPLLATLHPWRATVRRWSLQSYLGLEVDAEPCKLGGGFAEPGLPAKLPLVEEGVEELWRSAFDLFWKPGGQILQILVCLTRCHLLCNSKFPSDISLHELIIDASRTSVSNSSLTHRLIRFLITTICHLQDMTISWQLVRS